jgi:hypothetical protein
MQHCVTLTGSLLNLDPKHVVSPFETSISFYQSTRIKYPPHWEPYILQESRQPCNIISLRRVPALLYRVASSVFIFGLSFIFICRPLLRMIHTRTFFLPLTYTSDFSVSALSPYSDGPN